jgi:hypothetical protein
MKFCCPALQELHENSGSRGFGFFAAKYPDDFIFVLQHRAMDSDALPPLTESPVSLISELLLHKCPWCGAELTEFYKSDLKLLDRSELKLGIGR